MTLRNYVGALLRALHLRPPLPFTAMPPSDEWPRLVSRCQDNPADAAIHVLLARNLLQRGQALPAYACYRTARALGFAADAALEQLFAAHGIPHSATGEPPIARVETLLEYQRLARVAGRVRELLGNQPGNVLDLGGGSGALALLLQECNYFLAEPAVNGINSTAAARYGCKFDVVTCSHVLEHIPEPDKTAFLDTVIALTPRHVILLGPTIGPTPPPPLDAIFLRLTNAGWAAEHIACGWPRLNKLRDFARDRNLSCRATENGNLAATYWMVFAHHYAWLAGKQAEMAEITAIFNREICPDPRASPPPNDYLVEFSRSAIDAVTPA